MQTQKIKTPSRPSKNSQPTNLAKAVKPAIYKRAACIAAAQKITEENPTMTIGQMYQAALTLASGWTLLPVTELLHEMTWAFEALGYKFSYPPK